MLSTITTGLFALSLAASCNAAAAMKQVEFVEKAFLAQQGWNVARTPAAEETLTLQIGLTLQNTDKMVNTLLDVSNRKSKNYGKWLDRDEVNQIVQPSQQANDAVVKWLNAEGISKVSSDGTWVTFVSTIETANRILNANFQGYERDGVAKIRTTAYSVPQHLIAHIDIIHPTTFFGKTEAFHPVHFSLEEEIEAAALEKRQQAQAIDGPATIQQTVASSCAQSISPFCVKQLYNVGNYTASADSGSRIGFGSFLNESAQFDDLKLYLDYFKLPSHNFSKVEVNAGAIPKVPSTGESNLDAQNMVGVAAPLPITEFLTAGKPPFVPDLEMKNDSQNSNEPYLPYYQFLLSKRNSELPQVISNSYGEPEQTVPRKYAERVCSMIGMMGLRGITVLESSGDTGIGAACLKNDGSNKARFDPQFPGTCPWITAVGGTQAVNPEIAWRDSSGGFSDYFPQPAYQADAVNTYLEEKAAPAVTSDWTKYYNPRGRAFPDISAHSLAPNYVIFDGKAKGQSGGTSAAAPVMAGIFGLLNDARFKAGLPSIGFVNPWLYDSGSDFVVDIIAGAGRGCDGVNHQTGKKLVGAGVIPGAFWNATAGWDPVTGLGIPDFQKMVAASIGADSDDE